MTDADEDGDVSVLAQELQKAINNLYLVLWLKASDGTVYCAVCDHEVGSGHEAGCELGAIEKYVDLREEQ